MRAILIPNNPFNWFSPFNELNWFEPILYQDSIEESVQTTPFEYKIEYSLPGFKKKDLKMRVVNGQLIITGHHRKSGNPFFGKKGNFSESSFSRATVLTDDMDLDKLKAKFKDGVLLVTIPKKQGCISYREIPINRENVQAEDTKAVGSKTRTTVMESVKKRFHKIFRSAA